MNELQEKQLKVLQETKDYYSKDTKRRAHDNSVGCKYDGASVPNCKGTGCAVGRLLKKKERAELDKHYPDGIDVSSIYKELPPRVRGLGIRFLRDLQGFHDDCANWGNDGLTSWGQVDFDLIEERIKKGYYFE